MVVGLNIAITVNIYRLTSLPLLYSSELLSVTKWLMNKVVYAPSHEILNCDVHFDNHFCNNLIKSAKTVPQGERASPSGGANAARMALVMM